MRYQGYALFEPPANWSPSPRSPPTTPTMPAKKCHWRSRPRWIPIITGV